MTREEAIKVMFYIKNHFWNDTEVNRAVDMAIEALSVKDINVPSKTKFKEAYQWRDTCPSCGAMMER